MGGEEGIFHEQWVRMTHCYTYWN